MSTAHSSRPTSNSTKPRSRSSSPGRPDSSTRPFISSTSPRPPTTWWPTGRRHNKNDGKRPAATPPPPSPTKSRPSRQLRISPVRRATPPEPPSTNPPPMTGSATLNAGSTPPQAAFPTASTTSGSTAAETPTTAPGATPPNGSGVHKEDSVVDAGFLELTRLGVKAPNDPLCGPLPAGRRPVHQGHHACRRHVASATPTTATVRKPTGLPGTGAGIGRPWPLISGERGEYVARPSAGTRSRICRPWPTPPTTGT